MPPAVAAAYHITAIDARGCVQATHSDTTYEQAQAVIFLLGAAYQFFSQAEARAHGTDLHSSRIGLKVLVYAGLKNSQPDTPNLIVR